MHISRFVAAACSEVESVIDLGCGIGISSGWARSVGVRDIVGVDCYEGYRTKASEQCNFVCADALEYISGLEDRSFDIALMIDLIEHLDKDKAEALIQQAQRVSDHIIIFTPNGFWEQDGTESYPEYGFNPAQVHVSGWDEMDLKEFGFKCEITGDSGNAESSIIAEWRRADG